MRSIVPMALILIVGCKSPIFGERFQKYVGPGMNSKEVKSILGNPDGYEQKGDLELYTYSNKMMSGWGWDKATYQVIFRNDRVIQYGIESIVYREWVRTQPSTQVNVIVH